MMKSVVSRGLSTLRVASARRVNRNQKLPSALLSCKDLCTNAAAPAMPFEEQVLLTKSCAKRINQLKAKMGNDGLHLRVHVDSGGCSGFQYVFNMEDEELDEEEDITFQRDGATLAVDTGSYEFIRGATIDFEQELIRSAFAVVNNPNSESACGCGSSFAVKNFEDHSTVH